MKNTEEIMKKFKVTLKWSTEVLASDESEARYEAEIKLQDDINNSDIYQDFDIEEKE